MTIHKKGQAHWEGDIKHGKGYISSESGALKDQPYGFNTRFEGKPGTNPEELLGAAHSACFSMALSLMLGEAGHTLKASIPSQTFRSIKWMAALLSLRSRSTALLNCQGSIKTSLMKSSKRRKPDVRFPKCLTQKSL